MKQQSLLTSTILLTISSLLVRTINMISMIFLSQILGSEGIGIYELTMSIYMTGVVFASAGLSASVSRMVAEELGQKQDGNIKKIMGIALSFAITAGLLISCILFTFAPHFANNFIHNTQSTKALRFLALSIPFIACSSCFKGYFYAMRKTIYPASSDILEQFVKLGLIFVLVQIAPQFGIENTYVQVAMGLTLGEMISWSYLFTLFLVESKKQIFTSSSTLSIKEVCKRLASILIPIAMISYISYIFLPIENIIIPNGLKKSGESLSSSMSLYGILKGMVLPILFFPSAFLTAFSTTLIPEIAKANILKLKERVHITTSRVLQLSFILSFLVVAIFLSYSNELGFILYKSDAIGPMLRMLAIIVPFTYIEVITDGILKGLNKQIYCLKYSILDSICRIVLLYIFLPFKGIQGLIGIMIISSIFTSTLNFNKLLAVTHIKFQLTSWLIKPTIAAAFASSYSRLIINKLFRYSLGLTTKVLLGISLIVVLYIAVLFLIQAIKQDDLVWLRKQLSFSSYKKHSIKIQAR